MRDSELQRRIDRLQAQASDVERAAAEGPLSERTERRAELARIRRRLAMLLEDERRPTLRATAEFGRSDDYTAWRKAQGL